MAGNYHYNQKFNEQPYPHQQPFREPYGDRPYDMLPPQPYSGTPPFKEELMEHNLSFIQEYPSEPIRSASLHSYDQPYPNDPLGPPPNKRYAAAYHDHFVTPKSLDDGSIQGQVFEYSQDRPVDNVYQTPQGGFGKQQQRRSFEPKRKQPHINMTAFSKKQTPGNSPAQEPPKVYPEVVLDPTKKHPLMVVHEKLPKLVWEFSNKGSVHRPEYTASAEVNGELFYGVGPTKKRAKLLAAISIVEALEKQQPEYATVAAAAGAVQQGEGAALAQAGKKRAKKRKAVEVDLSKPPIVLLHEKFPGKALDFSVAKEEGSGSSKIFTMTLMLEGKEFVATGQSKKQAKQATAALALSGLFNLTVPTPVPEKKQAIVENPIGPVTPTFTSIDAVKSPAMLLHEKCQGRNIEFKIIGEEGTNARTKLYIMQATIDGKDYTGSGRSKKLAKQAVCSVVLAELFNFYPKTLGDFAPSKADDEIQRGDLGQLEPQALSTKVILMINLKFTALSSLLQPQFQTRKVLAGCVMTRGDNLDLAEVIAVATGTKCISGENMSEGGLAVNDCHAEILVRRAMKRYLYAQIEMLLDGKPSILELSAGGLLKLKDEIRFHLYISSPPCGDARIFSLNENTADSPLVDTNPLRSSRGILRVKIEAGEGTIPVTSDSIPPRQTWDGVLSGERLLTMSCSDKVARWTALGFQGSLLSELMAPCHFSSIIIGSLFNQAHIFRALYGRLAKLPGLEVLPERFQLCCPEIIGTLSPEMRNTAKAPSHAMVWNVIDNQSDVINTVTGKGYEYQMSNLCKKALFERHKRLVQRMAPSTQMDISNVYSEAKSSAKDYQAAKNLLYQAMAQQKMGPWVRKPIEQDQFALFA